MANESAHEEGDLDSLFRARSSRPHLDKGWEDNDHYYQQHDVPGDQFSADEWKEKYKDMDEIHVNGSKQRQWNQGKEEIRQILKQCEELIGKESLRREDFVEFFFGVRSPLFEVFQRRLGMTHHDYVKFISTCARLSANQ